MPPPKDDELDEAIKDVPTATTKNEDPWGHEGRSRPRRSVDLDAPAPGQTGLEGVSTRMSSILNAPPPPPPDPKKKLISIGVGVLATIVVLGAVGSYTSKKNEVSEKPATGSIAVSSTPPGAEIFVGGQATGRKTPSEVPGVRVNEPIDVSVRLAGYLPEPALVSARIPLGAILTTADFRMMPAKSIRVQTEPPGAVVEANGRLVGGTTPLNLPDLMMGRTMDITISLQGHRPLKAKIAATETASVSFFKLEPSRNIEINSEPSGASISIDGQVVGTTPQSELAVPAAKFTLRIDRPGFEPFITKFKPGTKNEKVDATLKLLPLSKMPLSPEDKKKVQELQGDLNRAKLDLAAAKSKKAQAETRLDAELKKNRSFVSDTSKYQEVIDRESGKIDELEQKIDELTSEWESMQEEVLGRMGEVH